MVKALDRFRLYHLFVVGYLQFFGIGEDAHTHCLFAQFLADILAIVPDLNATL